jgi:hypothetical protein
MDRFVDPPQADIVQTLQGHGAVLEEQSKTLARIEVALIGDPFDEAKPGALSRLQRCESFIAGCKTRKNEEAKSKNHWLRWTLEGAIMVLVTILVYKVFKVQL